MSKIVIELRDKPKDGDMLIFKDGFFDCVQDKAFLYELNHGLLECNITITNLIAEIEKLKSEIKILKGED